MSELVSITPAEPEPDPRFAKPYHGWGKCELCGKRVPQTGGGRITFYGLGEQEYPRWCRACLVKAGDEYADVLEVFDAAVAAERERLKARK